MNWFLLIVALVIVVGVLPLSRDGEVRSASRIVLFLVFVICASVAAGCVYFSLAYVNKGAGAVMFAAVPFGLLAWLAYTFLRGGGNQVGYTDLSPDPRAAYTLEKLDDMRADFEEVIRYNTAQLKRFWLSPIKRRRYRDEMSHAQFMLRYIEEQRRHLQRVPINAKPAAGAASVS